MRMMKIIADVGNRFDEETVFQKESTLLEANGNIAVSNTQHALRGTSTCAEEWSWTDVEGRDGAVQHTWIFRRSTCSTSR